MVIQVNAGNYRNDAILRGFSDLKKLRTDRPLVFEKGKGMRIHGNKGGSP